jgi:hypothetical protein
MGVAKNGQELAGQEICGSKAERRNPKDTLQINGEMIGASGRT